MDRRFSALPLSAREVIRNAGGVLARAQRGLVAKQLIAARGSLHQCRGLEDEGEVIGGLAPPRSVWGYFLSVELGMVLVPGLAAGAVSRRAS